VLTALLIGRTFWYLFHSLTNVPYADQWVLLADGWKQLWEPYWGQRPLLPRLLILLSVKYLHYSMAPFIVLSVAAQIGMAAVLIWLARRLLTGWRFWAASIAIVHLLLSSLQMEIFIQGIGVQYTIGYASAAAAIASDSIALGLVSCACLAVGPLVWPILIVRNRSRALLYAAIGVVIAVAYAIHYTRPEMGMGIAGVLRHPIQAFEVVALVLGGPASLYSRALGIATGAIGILVAAWFLRRPDPLMLIALLLIGSAVAVAIGRIAPDVLTTASQPLPSRYLAPTLAFWAVLFTASLAQGRWAILVGLVTLGLTFGTWNWQWRLAREWGSISQAFDAIGSGFLVGVTDEEYMSRIIAAPEFRERMVVYMREHRLSVFAEPRAGWLGHAAPASTCHGHITAVVPLDSGGYRVRGMVDARGRLDVLLVDHGIVRGLARTLPIQSEYSPENEFFGYSRDAAPSIVCEPIRW